MRTTSIVLILFLLLCTLHSSLVQPILSASALAVPQQSATQSPNIIFILTDDLDDNPETLATMPNLQQLLVEQGMSFTNAVVTMPSCCPSRTSVLTGQYVHNHGVSANKAPYGGYDRFMENQLETTTVGTLMTAAGYRTALMGKYLNHYPFESDPTHVPPGWTEWYGYVKGGLYRRYVLNENGTWVKYTGLPEEYSTDVFSAKAVDFIERHQDEYADQPFFLLLTPFAPHHPAHAAPRHEGLFLDVQAPRTVAYNEVDITDKPKWVQKLEPLTKEQEDFIDDLYRARLRSMQAIDEMIGALYTTLAENNQLDNTYIMFSSDNGLHQGEHRIVYGKGTAYDAAIHVPFIVRGPNVPAGYQQDAVISLVDMAPTFGDVAGITLFPASFDGRSILPLLHTDATVWRTAVLFENPDSGAADGDLTLNQQTNRFVGGVRQWPAAIADEFAEFLDDDADADAFFDDEQTIVIGRDGMPLIINSTLSLDGGKPETTGGMASDGFRTSAYKYVEYKNGDRELYDLINDPLEIENQVTNASPALLAVLAAHLAELLTCAGEGCRRADLLIPPQVFPLTTDWVTPTATSTVTATPENTPTPTVTPTPTTIQTATVAPSVTPTVQPTISVETTASPTGMLTPTPTPTITSTATPNPLTTATVTMLPTSIIVLPTVVPTVTVTVTGTPDDVGGEGKAEPFHLYLPLIH